MKYVPSLEHSYIHSTISEGPGHGHSGLLPLTEPPDWKLLQLFGKDKPEESAQKRIKAHKLGKIVASGDVIPCKTVKSLASLAAPRRVPHQVDIPHTVRPDSGKSAGHKRKQVKYCRCRRCHMFIAGDCPSPSSASSTRGPCSRDSNNS